MVFQIIAIYIIVKRDPSAAPISERATWPERWAALRRGGLIEVVIIFSLSIGGMFLGWFTPTEAASVGAMGMLLVGLVERKVLAKLMTSLVSAKLAAMVFFIITCGTVRPDVYDFKDTDNVSYLCCRDGCGAMDTHGRDLLLYFVMGCSLMESP